MVTHYYDLMGSRSPQPRDGSLPTALQAGAWRFISRVNGPRRYVERAATKVLETDGWKAIRVFSRGQTIGRLIYERHRS